MKLRLTLTFRCLKNSNNNNVNDQSSKQIVPMHKFQEILISQNQKQKRSKLLSNKQGKFSDSFHYRLA